MEKIGMQASTERKVDFECNKLDILYEDTHIVVINKPSGMLTVPYPGSKARTAVGVLGRLMRKKGTYAAHHRPFVVHRLDRDTSGVMIFALTEYMQKMLMRSWQSVVKERLYRAISENGFGEQLADAGIIDSPIAYNAYNIGFVPKAGDKPSPKAQKFKVASKNKSIYERHLDFSTGEPRFRTVPAITHYRIIERGPTHTLFELSLETGKKNQIRAHLASKGYTIAGDENYRARTDPFGRLGLHAKLLEFVHPATGKHMCFEINEPLEWCAYVKRGDFRPAEPVWQAERRALRAAKREMFKFNNCR